MGLGYRILFARPAENTDVHRIRNFAEDLHRVLRDGGLGSVPNMDHAKDEVLVTVNATRHLGPTLKAIRRQLARSNLEDNVSVERLNE
jgi:hypothetical protein